ncbi:MAG: cyanophycin synthetase [Chlorobium phaeobacteroides]|uniref:Glutathione synthase n=1 Tax=Chlorobium phaeobacteroides (strain BS1) TaxID=331678 RepID=B3EN01_CHLPB|nr:cyanophycin synthetase [Chlorobium phaeobacteroides]MBL6955378.1 cyanophycin synthetase [Chlorobium phaeobacteroides]
MNLSATDTTWSLADKSVSLNGCGFGSNYPVVLISLTGRALTKEQLAGLSELLHETLPSSDILPLLRQTGKENAFRTSLEWLLHTLHQAQREADLPIYELGGVLSVDPPHARLFLPSVIHSVKPLLELLRTILELMEHQVRGKYPQKQLKRLVNNLTDLQKTSPQGSNIPLFVKTSCEMGIPFQELPSGVIQYGQGSRGHWLFSSFTENTAFLSAQIARNKPLAGKMLRQAGLPVSDSKIATTLDRTLRAAEELGYPVVVKPADLDAGKGVSAGLLNPEEVTRAFNAAQKLSRNILVEKHFEGRDYRVTVFQNEVIWAVERVPGGVTGDGQHTIRELVGQLNADPNRGEGKHAKLQRLMWNDEAISLLKQSGMDASSVPEKGTFIRLRRTANVAAGGTPVGVFDKIHSDNKHLAIRTAQALRLDLAGVDILIPDIARSWHETGAIICEVNASPSLGTITKGNLFSLILRKVIPGNGRIPIALVLGDQPSSTLLSDIEGHLLKQGITAGCHDTKGVRVNGEAIKSGFVELFDAGKMLNVDTTVDTILLSLDNDSVLRTGLPFARFDLLVLAGELATEDSMTEILDMILPACDGKIISIEGSKPEEKSYGLMTHSGWEQPVSSDVAAEKIVSEMIACSSKHLQTDATEE